MADMEDYWQQLLKYQNRLVLSDNFSNDLKMFSKNENF